MDGIYSADPNLISDAKNSDINIDDALLLSGSGAKVLQHQALLYAKEKGISLGCKCHSTARWKRHTHSPQGNGNTSTSIVIDQKLLLLRHSERKSFDYLRHTRMIFQQDCDMNIYQLIDTQIPMVKISPYQQSFSHHYCRF